MTSEEQLLVSEFETEGINRTMMEEFIIEVKALISKGERWVPTWLFWTKETGRMILAVPNDSDKEERRAIANAVIQKNNPECVWTVSDNFLCTHKAEGLIHRPSTCPRKSEAITVTRVYPDGSCSIDVYPYHKTAAGVAWDLAILGRDGAQVYQFVIQQWRKKKLDESTLGIIDDLAPEIVTDRPIHEVKSFLEHVARSFPCNGLGVSKDSLYAAACIGRYLNDPHSAYSKEDGAKFRHLLTNLRAKTISAERDGENFFKFFDKSGAVFDPWGDAHNEGTLYDA